MNELPNYNPLVSIVLPTLDGSRYIATSVESCLMQTHQNFELIVVVDGRTTDNTEEIVNEYSDSRIKIIHNKFGAGGLPGSLNLGFSHARGEFYTWTSDDNYYKQDALEIMLSYLVKNPEIGLVYTGFWFIDEEGCIIRESELLPPDSLMVTNPVGSCFLYRRQVAEEVGPYNVNIRMVEDVDFWMRLYQQSKLALIDDRYYYHRLHGESLTGKNYGGYLARRLVAETSRKYLHLNWFRYQELVSMAFIDESFDAYQKKDYKHVLPCIFQGTLRNPLWLRNRGVISIGLQSLFRVITNS